MPGAYLPYIYSFLNPSSITKGDYKGNFYTSRKQGLNAFSVFRQNYVNANYLIVNDSIHKQGIGIRVLNDRAGEYIGINRVSLLYSYSIPLNSEYRLHVGIAPSYINYRKEAQSFGGTASTGNLDLGAWLTSKKIQLGIAFNQVIPTSLTVIEEVDLLRPQYAFTGNYTFYINQAFKLDVVLVNIVNVQFPNRHTLGSIITYFQKIRAAIHYEIEHNINMLIGIPQIKLPQLDGKLTVDFVFSIPAPNQTFRRRNFIELLVNYNF